MSQKLIITLLCSMLFLISCKEKKKSDIEKFSPRNEANYLFGFDFNEYEIIEGEIEPNSTLSHLFAPYNISQFEINKVAEMANKKGLRYVSTGKDYYMLCRKDDQDSTLEYCVYVKNPVEYYIFNFNDTAMVLKGEKPVEIVEKELSGVIEKGSNLSEAIQNGIGSYETTAQLIEKVAAVYSWSIDFFRLQPNDRFKVIYTQKEIEGEPIGVGNIKAILFTHRDKDFYSFYFKDGEIDGFYNERGKTLKSMFLKAPVKFSRISSKYNLNRRIAYYGYKLRPHLGTDYAAPLGTPILATANGTVIESTRRGGNGKFVKIKHNDVYSTQYLHMKDQNVKKGDFVQQGDVIGWIGMTGNTGGPHVCYRFWKNGKQVDPTKEVLQESPPMDSTKLDDFNIHIDSIKPLLDQIEYPLKDSNIQVSDTNPTI